MSVKSFIHNILNAIKHIFDGMPEKLKKAVEIGVQVTDAVKNFDTANPGVADFLTTIIPGTIDDDIKTKLRAALPNIVVELRLVDATLGLTDPNEIMLAATKVIQQLDGDYKSAFLHSFATLCAQVAADGKLSWSDAVYLAEWVHNQTKK